jgi:uncharacterized protein involved in outer membrane biogenesis
VDKSAKRRTTILVTLGCVIAIVTAAVLVVPPLVTDRIRRAMNELPQYRAVVGEIHLQPLKGGVVVRNLELWKRSGEVPVPFFRADEVQGSLAWREFLRGIVVADVYVEGPEINIVDGPTPETSQLTVSPEKAKEAKREAMPIQINRFEVRNGNIHFRNFHSTPEVDVFVRDVRLVAWDMAFSKKLKDRNLVGRAEFSGVPMTNASLEVQLEIDPLATPLRGTMRASVESLQLEDLNSVFLAYADMKALSGTFSAYVEMTTAEGRFDGYIKPLVKDLELDAQAPDKGLLGKVKELAVDAATEIVENQPKQQVGTIVPVSGEFEDPNVDVWAATAFLLRNAFIKALTPGFLREDEK